jgi:hypothetical protein
MISLDKSVWTETDLRRWAKDHAEVNMVQAKQVLELFEELDNLREEVKNLKAKEPA